MQTNYVVAGWCYIISALLDAIDGHAARAFNQSKWIKRELIEFIPGTSRNYIISLIELKKWQRFKLISRSYTLLTLFTWIVLSQIMWYCRHEIRQHAGSIDWPLWNNGTSCYIELLLSSLHVLVPNIHGYWRCVPLAVHANVSNQYYPSISISFYLI